MAVATSTLAPYPHVELDFALREEPGFTPPPGVVELRGRDGVTLDLALGAHYFYTCVARAEPSFKLIEEFLELSRGDAGRHRFAGRSFSADKEWNSALSSRFAKIVGISFMSQHAGSTWFANLDSLWDDEVPSAQGTMRFEKVDADAFGPDYLAAPFDPTAGDVADALFALEFKGRVQKVTFDSPVAAEWRAQACNIACFGADGEPRRIKSWVLAFNYAFEHGKGCRERSALLVDDPIVGPANARPVERSREAVDGVVRRHLARQCGKLGAGRLVPSVLFGGRSAPQTVFPKTYVVDHPRLRGRAYVGWFATRGPDGELTWTDRPGTAIGPLLRRGNFDFHVDFEGSFMHGFIRVRGAPGPLGFADVRVRMQGPGGPGTPWRTERDAETWIRSLLGGGGEEVFVGQDATMLKACIANVPGTHLDVPAFTSEVQFVSAGSDSDGRYAVQVLRNGSILADGRAVRPADPDTSWWTESSS